MTVNMALAYIPGRMVASMKAIGKMANSTARGSTASQMELSAREDGKRASASLGSNSKKTEF